MGADGHIVIARVADFRAANPGVEPSDLGLYTGTVLGMDACWDYYGDNLYEGNYGSELDLTQDYNANAAQGRWFTPLHREVEAARRRALEWFETNAETHEVWT